MNEIYGGRNVVRDHLECPDGHDAHSTLLAELRCFHPDFDAAANLVHEFRHARVAHRTQHSRVFLSTFAVGQLFLQILEGKRTYFWNRRSLPDMSPLVSHN